MSWLWKIETEKPKQETPPPEFSTFDLGPECIADESDFHLITQYPSYDNTYAPQVDLDYDTKKEFVQSIVEMMDDKWEVDTFVSAHPPNGFEVTLSARSRDKASTEIVLSNGDSFNGRVLTQIAVRNVHGITSPHWRIHMWSDASLGTYGEATQRVKDQEDTQEGFRKCVQYRSQFQFMIETINEPELDQMLHNKIGQLHNEAHENSIQAAKASLEIVKRVRGI